MLPFLRGKNTAEEQALCREVREALPVSENDSIAAAQVRIWAENGRLNETIGLEQDIGTLAAEEQALCREVQEAVESGRVTAELREKLGLPGNERVAAGLLRTWAQDGTIARLIEDVQAGQARGELERRGEWSNGEAHTDRLEPIDIERKASDDTVYREIVLSETYQPYKQFGDEAEYEAVIREYNMEGAPESLAEYNELRYTDPKEAYLLDKYIRAVDKGDISVLVGYEQYQAVGEQIDEQLVGQRTQDGTEIKGFVSHFVDRIIGQQAANDIPMPGMRRGVAIEDALEALRNPVSVGQIQISSNGLKSVTYKGRNCIVRVNPDTGMLIQCNPK